jgi:hypothetical protein
MSGDTPGDMPGVFCGFPWGSSWGFAWSFPLDFGPDFCLAFGRIPADVSRAAEAQDHTCANVLLDVSPVIFLDVSARGSLSEFPLGSTLSAAFPPVFLAGFAAVIAQCDGEAF